MPSGLMDKRFLSNPFRYVFQCLLATVVIMVILSLLNVMKQTALVAALGASTFIAFAMPEIRASNARYLVGGYVIAILIGYPCKLLCDYSFSLHIVAIHSGVNYAVMGGIAVGLAIFFMAITNTEHPPATSVALGLVVNEWNYLTLIIVIVGIVFLALARYLLRPYLKNLIQ